MSCRTGLFLFVGASLALGGCGDGPTAPDPAAPGAPRPVGPYFDVRGLLDAQVQQLTARHPGVTKHVALRGGAPETVQVPQVKWADELQIFYQADINKAALRGAYRLDSTTEASGATRRTYTAQPGHPNASVTRLSVLSTSGQPQELEATLRQDNVLFSGQKQLHLTLQQGQLHTYEVRGTQKLILFDTLRYQTQAQVQ
ncbi:hypothetical protein [Hymenobacter sp. BT559]|uniref:hypothetical protein n=1 Tax=Hymenobacter sp. BT559 TaxID=2795729 RepID=UPI0018ED3B8E|nr:hypothetical protein [Hymenobacter sp. BT559]MBJ6143257.1 hypothetical protein [Hymenobacter sp. BT559]